MAGKMAPRPSSPLRRCVVKCIAFAIADARTNRGTIGSHARITASSARNARAVGVCVAGRM